MTRREFIRNTWETFKDPREVEINEFSRISRVYGNFLNTNPDSIATRLAFLDDVLASRRIFLRGGRELIELSMQEVNILHMWSDKCSQLKIVVNKEGTE